MIKLFMRGGLLFILILCSLKTNDIELYGINSLYEMKYFLNKNNIVYSIENESNNKRSLWYFHYDAYFITLNILNSPTKCGKTDLKLDFFNNKLYCIHINNISDGDVKACYQNEIGNYKNSFSNAEISIANDFLQYRMTICDSYLKRKVSDWIYKWS